MIKAFRFLFSLYGLITFVIVMCLALPFVLVTPLWGKVKGGNMVYAICRVWAKTWYLLCGFKHETLYEHPHDASKQYVFVANHASYMDIPPIVLAFNQPVRVLGKYEMVRYPIFGVIYRLAVVMVDRRDAERRAKSVRALKKALQLGISIFIYPEGTFNEDDSKPLREMFDGAFRLAIETQTPIKPMLVIDALDRLHHSSIFSLNPGKNRVVFLDEISVEGLRLSDLPQLKSKVAALMDAGLRRYRSYPEAL